MQGISEFIPTQKKINYLNALMKVGFDTIDFGSFVSSRTIPQLKDTEEVLEQLDLNGKKSKLLAIVANQRGAETAVKWQAIDYLGYPFSVSEVFQKRNTNKSIAESEKLVDTLLDICGSNDKELVVYISMAFGNPYREAWSAAVVEKWCEKLANKGVRILSLSDTIGTSNPESISHLFAKLIRDLPQVEFGAHLHTTPSTWYEKVEAAYDSGCLRFDGAIKGFGGCPMADDRLVGNMPMEKLVSFAQTRHVETGINPLAFENAYNKALETFPS